jgi:hypothetical protein
MAPIPWRLILLALAIATAAGWMRWAIVESRSRAVDAGFWFEPVTFSSPRIGGALTAPDAARIQQVARAEIDHAFEGWRVPAAGADPCGSGSIELRVLLGRPHRAVLR